MMPEKHALALRGKFCPLYFDSARPRMVSKWEPSGVSYASTVLDADRDQKIPRQHDRRRPASIHLSRTKPRMAALYNGRVPGVRAAATQRLAEPKK
jgi:hypothetical protein